MMTHQRGCASKMSSFPNDLGPQVHVWRDTYQKITIDEASSQKEQLDAKVKTIFASQIEEGYSQQMKVVEELRKWYTEGAKLCDPDLKDSLWITYEIEDDISREADYHTTFIAIDTEQKIQGVERTEVHKDAIPPYVEIKYLTSAFWNINAVKTKGDPRKVKGVGTCLVKRAIAQSIAVGGGGRVYVEALPRAASFYERLGFKRVDRAPKEPGTVPMELNVSRPLQ